MSECVNEQILQTYLDGELSGANLETVTAHVASCLSCARMARELEKENNLVTAALTAEFAASVPTERLRERIDTAIAGMNQTSPNAVRVAAFRETRGWFRSLSDLFKFTLRAFGYAGLMAVLLFAVIFAVIHRSASGPLTTAETGNQVATNNAGNEPLPPVVSAAPPEVVIPNSTLPAPGPSRQRRNAVKRAAMLNTSLANHVKLLPGERTYLQTIADLDSTIKSDKGNMKPALQAEYERNLAFVDRALAAARTVAKKNPNDPDAAQFMFSAYQSKVDLLNTVADARVYDRAH